MEAEDNLKQQNFEEFQKNKQSLLASLPAAKYTSEGLKEVESRFSGVMTLLNRKVERNEVKLGDCYYSSSFMSDLKDKRNLSFGNEVLQKMYKQYNLREFDSNFPKEVFDCAKVVFDNNEYYEQLELRAERR